MSAILQALITVTTNGLLAIADVIGIFCAKFAAEAGLDQRLIIFQLSMKDQYYTSDTPIETLAELISQDSNIDYHKLYHAYDDFEHPTGYIYVMVHNQYATNYTIGIISIANAVVIKSMPPHSHKPPTNTTNRLNKIVEPYLNKLLNQYTARQLLETIKQRL